jgi:hypothetical protein
MFLLTRGCDAEIAKISSIFAVRFSTYSDNLFFVMNTDEFIRSNGRRLPNGFSIMRFILFHLIIIGLANT